MQSYQRSQGTPTQGYVTGPSGKKYKIDVRNRLVDPATGVIYDPSSGFLIDPRTGLLLDTGTGVVYDSQGQPVGQVPVSELYGLQFSTPQTVSFKWPGTGASAATGLQWAPANPSQPITRPLAKKVKTIAKKSLSAAKKGVKMTARALDELAERQSRPPHTLSQNGLYTRLIQAYSNLEEGQEFMRDVLDRMVEYVIATNTTYIPEAALKEMYPGASSKTLRKVKAAIKYMMEAGIIPE